MKTIASSFCLWTQPVLLAFILSSGYPTGSAGLQEDVPKVSVKVSTSLAQSSSSQEQAEASRRQQRSPINLPAQPSFQELTQPSTLTGDGSERASLESSYQSSEANEPRNLFGRIWELPEYRRSVSSSFSARGLISPQSSLPPQRSANESFQVSRVNNLVPRSTAACDSKIKDCADGRSLRKVLRRAKHLLSDTFTSLERFATSGSLMFGSSLLAAVIPLAVALMPDAREKRKTSLDETMLSRLGLQGRVDSLMGWIERSVDHLPHVPHLHPQECLKRSICEAHSEPKKYGAIGFALRLFFPATNVSITERMDNMDYKVINKYRHAAGFGQSRRVDSVNGTGDPSACKLKYDDCLVSLLEVARNMMDIFLQ